MCLVGGRTIRTGSRGVESSAGWAAMNPWISLVFGIVLTFGTGLFVASEFALVNVDRRDLERRRDNGETGLDQAISALKHTSTHLSSAQLGITLTTLLSGFTLEPAFAAFLRPVFEWLGIAQVAQAAMASIGALIIATVMSMVLGELVPKTMALTDPIAVVKFVSPPQVVFTKIFRFAVDALNGTSNLVLHSLGIEPKEELSGARTAEELSSLVRRSAMEGALAPETATLLAKTLEFSEQTAADVMTPRPRLKSVPRTASAADVVDIARDTGYSRFPVTDDDIDDVVGIVHLKQAIGVPLERRGQVPVTALMDEIVRVPETMTIDTLLDSLRNEGLQIALIVDEYGGTSGVATLEDIVEEIIGDVADEHDLAAAGIVRLLGGGWAVPGIMRPDEVVERTGISIPDDGPYETLGGLVMTQLRRIPEVSDRVVLDHAVLTVERMDGRRIDRVRLEPRTPEVSAHA